MFAPLLGLQLQFIGPGMSYYALVLFTLPPGQPFGQIAIPILLSLGS